MFETEYCEFRDGCYRDANNVRILRYICTRENAGRDRPSGISCPPSTVVADLCVRRRKRGRVFTKENNKAHTNKVVCIGISSRKKEKRKKRGRKRGEKKKSKRRFIRTGSAINILFS
jgi:hypothetical protein